MLRITKCRASSDYFLQNDFLLFSVIVISIFVETKCGGYFISIKYLRPQSGNPISGDHSPVFDTHWIRSSANPSGNKYPFIQLPRQSLQTDRKKLLFPVDQRKEFAFQS